MQELAQGAFDSVRPIFQNIEDNRAIVFSVIEGNNPGRIFVDRPDGPSTALLRFAGGEIYLGGRADNEALNREIVELMLNDLASPPHLLIFSFSDAWKRALDELLKDRGVTRVIRDTFALSPEQFNASHSDWRSRVPERYRVQLMDRRLAEGVHELDLLWGSLDNFFSRAFGFCVMHDDEMVSRCCPVALGDRRCETGVETAEKYRRQGYATLAACAFIEHCLEQGFMPEWGCFYNVASKSLALKLGFVQKPDVEVHCVRLQE